jgi:hypothetical protein
LEGIPFLRLKPNFAFQVISAAKLLFTRNEGLFVNFKKKVFLYYLDAQPLIDMGKAIFLPRLPVIKIGISRCLGTLSSGNLRGAVQFGIIRIGGPPSAANYFRHLRNIKVGNGFFVQV